MYAVSFFIIKISQVLFSSYIKIPQPFQISINFYNKNNNTNWLYGADNNKRRLKWIINILIDNALHLQEINLQYHNN